MRIRVICGLAVLVFALSVHAVTVTPSAPNGWTFNTTAGAGTVAPASYLAPGFETPPLGIGSVHLAVGNEGGAAAQARNTLYAGTLLSSLTELSYSTFTDVDGSGSQAPYLILLIDQNNDGTVDDQLFFEPVYQTGAYSGDPVPNQGTLTPGQWQTWNAMVGGWWSLDALTFGPPLVTLSTYIAANSNARIVNSSTGLGGVRIVTGFGSGAWDNFVGAADNFVINDGLGQDVYDFEPEAGSVITVTPTNLDGWTLTTFDDGNETFGAAPSIVTGPATPPLGDGSLQLAVGADGGDAAQARNNAYDGELLRDLSQLVYSTYVQVDGSGGQAPYIILNVDYDGNGTTDDFLFFEPVYQSATFFPSNPQGALVVGAWQTWDVRSGGWWSVASTGGATPGVGVKPLSAILDAEPDARLANDSSGSLRIVAGFGDGAWNNFLGNADELTVAFDGPFTTYDFEPIPEISIGDVTQLEGTGGTTNFVFNLTLSEAVSQTVTVDFTTTDNTALAADLDFTSQTSTATFTPGSTSTTITVAVGTDTRFEPDEVFFIDLSNAQNANIAAGETQATGTIQNDDAQPTISIGDVSQAEGNAGNTPMTFTVSLSNASYQTITVDWSTLAGTATSGVDYAANSGTVTFVPNDVSETVTVQIAGDTTFESDESFDVILATPASATINDGTGTGTIQNDDAQPTISINDVAQLEGNAGNTPMTFTVTLSNPSDQTVTVDWTTVAGSATSAVDFVPNSGTLTFVPGDVSETLDVQIAGDTTFESDETFDVTLNTPANATITDDTGTGTIQNDDAQPTISINDVAQLEGNAGNTPMTFTVTLSNDSDQTITVDWSTTAVSATSGVDYVANSGTLTFVPGDISESLDVQIVGDGDFESDETFNVELAAAANATINDGTGVGTIQNDDGVPLISISDAAQAEGNAGNTPMTFTVTLSNPSDQTVTVGWTTVAGSATSAVDFVPNSGTLTFVPGDVSETLDVQIAGDTTFESDETFDVTLNTPANATITDGTGTGTIQNDDGQPTITINDVPQAEGNAGNTPMTFTVALSNASSQTITVDWSILAGTAASGVDYVANSGTVTFVPGDISETLTVQIIGDTMFESDETFDVTLNTPANATITDGTGTGTIQNDDGAPTVAIDDVSLSEGDAGFTSFVLTITLSNASAETITIPFTTNPGTATSGVDYTPNAGNVVFAPGDISETIAVQVIGETDFEANETFFVDLSAATTGTASVADNQGAGTIVNDDGPIADLSIAKTGPSQVTVGQNVEYTITVTNSGPQDASNVVVTDVIPTGTTFVSATASQGSCSGTTTVVCNLGAIANGGTATISLIVTAPPTPITFTNTATVANTPETDPIPGNNAGSAPAVAGLGSIPTASELGLAALGAALLALALMKLR